MHRYQNIWIAESYSCQKDIITLIKSTNLANYVRIFASHSLQRPELKQLADVFIQQPNVVDSADWLLQACVEFQVKLLFCGKHGHHIEALRFQFEHHGIQLVTGAITVEQHNNINDKFIFSNKCLMENLPAIACKKVTNTFELNNAIEQFESQYNQICAKPVHGVYGAGFVQLRRDVNYFKKFQSSTICNTKQFIEAYSQLEYPIAYLILPFLSGQECSVDIACNKGKVLSQVTRIKFDFYQECYTEHACHAICKILVELFDCDGLINIQFKQDQNLKWHILEINPRPAGGFAYTAHTGVNLIAELIANKLSISLEREVTQTAIQVLPISQSIQVDLNN
ncbi:carbamoyl-phosphate synthase [Acinetobacter sp. 194]|uniref:ATP-grasp domain-containing protein n=1 Tax=Acinetobacter shaoyimingii TaxID=2715164 RepID=UPI00140749AD|nr:ATP-grasp domain-containing protein [Acinetobacter shaoyimingii]NHB58539.1 carbamoyl-phosphate synthase [Acinetobacter shaoyimingii]